jgi:hypothetical protein
MGLHAWLGRHAPDLVASHWERGHFVSRCSTCGAAMIKLPGLAWQLRTAAA